LPTYVIGGFAAVNGVIQLHAIQRVNLPANEHRPTIELPEPGPGEIQPTTNRVERMRRWNTRQAAAAWLSLRPNLTGFAKINLHELTYLHAPTDGVPTY
jgi:hypothetical protein